MPAITREAESALSSCPCLFFLSFLFFLLACFMASPAFPFPSGVLANAGVPIGENKTTVTASYFQSVFEIFTTCLKISFNNSFRIKTEMMFHAWFPQPSVWKNGQVIFAFFNLIFSLFHRPFHHPEYERRVSAQNETCHWETISIPFHYFNKRFVFRMQYSGQNRNFV